MRREWPRTLTALLGALALFGCGGDGMGGGGGGQPPPQGNRPPGFTSSPTVSVPENSTGTIYTATATDPDGNPLTFSLSGGADRTDFSISAAGALSFVATPDFEAPADADGNNVYLVQISVSDGMTSAVLDLGVTVTNGGSDSFAVRRVGAGFVEPLYVAPVPDGSGRVFVVEKAGRIRILNPQSGAINTLPFLDIRGGISSSSERGLLGLATAPDFASTGTFYIHLTNLAGDIEIRRYQTLAGNRDLANPASADVILVVPHPNFANHNGGWMDFGPDGNLYISIGDGGSGGDPPENAQNRNVLLGKILRISVASDAFPADPSRDYAIPATNPFAQGGGSPEIWALGLRNPFRACFDPLTQNLWIGDVGQGSREEIDLMDSNDGGANFGWDFLEGTAPFEGQAPAGLTPPVAEYLHGSGPRQGNVVTGGCVYRGPVESLRGQYFFADFAISNIWSIPVAQVSIGTTINSSAFILRNAGFTPNQGTIDNISSFGVDESGNLYIVDFDGEVFRVEPS
jgi:glucose/arabinose dehydrogenase